MPGRLPLLLRLTAAFALLAIASCERRPPPLGRTHSTIAISFPDEPMSALFAAPPAGKDKRYVAVWVQDLVGDPWRGKAALRGFSAWHHGANKPSLRVKPKGSGSQLPTAFELSRPEDPLALCNWLPDQLAKDLGLLHEHSRPVRVVLDGEERGVYLRSVRPGDDLCALSGRTRGTFYKGDSLGARRHLDLWAGVNSWRRIGSEDPRAERALDELLAALRAPASPASWRRLEAVLDLEAAAKATAVAALVGSIHADAAHNHVLFFDPTRDRLEPLLWDANGFGIHAEADLAVDVMRHPLAARLACHPEFVHRRNELLWQLLTGPGSADELIATADTHLRDLDEVLRRDPEIARLVLRRGVFEVEPVAYEQLPAARAAFATFVREREAALRAFFGRASAHVEAVDGDPDKSRVTVFGNVGVEVARTDGAPVHAPDGRPVHRLLPGLSQELIDKRQHQAADGRGVSAPFAKSAALSYVLDCAPDRLTLTNPFTGAEIIPAQPPSPAATRSLHPWEFPAPLGELLTLGPGDVQLHAALEVPAQTTLRIAPGTRLHAAGGIRCRGPLIAAGTAAAPIEITCTGAGIQCVGSEVRLSHLTLHDAAKWDTIAGSDHELLGLRGSSSELSFVRCARASGTAIAIVGGEARLDASVTSRTHGTALVATAGATVTLEDCELLFPRRAILARDGARVRMHGGLLRGHMVGVRAERTGPSGPGAIVRLENVTCSDAGQFDVDCDIYSRIILSDTQAIANPLAAGRVDRGGLAPGWAATPR